MFNDSDVITDSFSSRKSQHCLQQWCIGASGSHSSADPPEHNQGHQVLGQKCCQLLRKVEFKCVKGIPWQAVA